MSEWRPISTAPRDGSRFLGMYERTGNSYATWYGPARPSNEMSRTLAQAFDVADSAGVVVWWCRDSSGQVTSFSPTHWKPLPSRPDRKAKNR